MYKASLLPADQRAQVERKARLIGEAFALGGVDAMVPGQDDLALGWPFVRQLGQDFKLPYLAANLECDGAPAFPGSKVVEISGMTVGILGVVDNGVKAPECKVQEPLAALQREMAGKAPNVWLLLSNLSSEEEARVLAGLPQVDLVVNGKERRQLPAPSPLGGNGGGGGGLLLAAGARGKQVGLLQFVPGASVREPGSKRVWQEAGMVDALANEKDRYTRRIAEFEKQRDAARTDAERERYARQIGFFKERIQEVDAKLATATSLQGPTQPVTWRLADLDDTLADHPATRALLDAAKRDIEGMTTAAPTTALISGPFAGSAACAGCHAPEAEQWAQTAHAHAYASLVQAGRAKDDACWSCHVTGAFHGEGPKTSNAVAGLENVGCESCHGPGKAHVASPSTAPMVRNPPLTTCTQCHDSRQDGGRFNPDTYRTQILHIPHSVMQLPPSEGDKKEPPAPILPPMPALPTQAPSAAPKR